MRWWSVSGREWTVSVLIFVDWVPPFTAASCPHSLGSDVASGEAARQSSHDAKLDCFIALLLDVQGSVALGMILVACCPPGNVSNILTHRAGGNVALSVSMTAVSNALAIVLMPLNFAFWGALHPTAAPPTSPG